MGSSKACSPFGEKRTRAAMTPIEYILALRNRLEPHSIGPTDVEVASSQPLRVILDFGLDDYQVAILWLSAGVHTHRVADVQPQP